MFIPIRKKPRHVLNSVSRKAVNNFISFGLRVIQANPLYYFHQTLSFPVPVVVAKEAKQIFNKFVKSVLKFYEKNDLGIYYVQERRTNGTIHYHVCFFFFSADKLPFAPSRMKRDFRTDIFKRWSKHNYRNENCKPVHDANELNEYKFTLEKTIGYFTRALVVPDKPPKRAETIWWGTFNKENVLKRSTERTKEQVKAAFNKLFKKSSRNGCRAKVGSIDNRFLIFDVGPQEETL